MVAPIRMVNYLMPVKHVLVYLDNDAACAMRTRFAADVAARHGAHLTGLYMRRLVALPGYAAAEIPDSVLAQFDAANEKLAENVKQEFATRVEGIAPTSEWRMLRGVLPDAIAEQARCADLLVIPQAHEATPKLHGHYDPASVLLRVPIPVLIVPPAGDIQVPNRHAVIAWNNTREAARATREALPLLAEMTRATVLRIGKAKKDELPDQDIVNYLARQGLNVEQHTQSREGTSVGEALLSYVVANGSDLVVMGGYGHSRAFEMVLGGMTHFVLEHLPVPVLMSH